MTSAEMSVPLPDDPGREQRDEQSVGNEQYMPAEQGQQDVRYEQDVRNDQGVMDEQQHGMPAGDQPRPADSAADGAGDAKPMALLGGDELQTVVSRWREIQAEFVDQPRRAMQDADALVSDLMERLTRTFSEERERLESRWSNDESVSTEDLRRGLQRYRSFFERLLAA
jgi:hypothetical protein